MMNDAKVIRIEWDGKFTVTYELDTGESSAFRVVPAMGRLIRLLPSLIETCHYLQTVSDIGEIVDSNDRIEIVITGKAALDLDSLIREVREIYAPKEKGADA